MVALRGGEGLWRGIYALAIVLLVLLVLLVDGHTCLLGIREPSNVPRIRRHSWWGREEGGCAFVGHAMTQAPDVRLTH